MTGQLPQKSDHLSCHPCSARADPRFISRVPPFPIHNPLLPLLSHLVPDDPSYTSVDVCDRQSSLLSASNKKGKEEEEEQRSSTCSLDLVAFNLATTTNAMIFCLDDLIPSTVFAEPEADLDSDNMLVTVSPVHRNDLTLSSYQRSHSPSISSASTTSIFCDTDFDVDMAFNGDEEAARRLMFPNPNPYYSPSLSVPGQQVFYAPQSPPLPSQHTWASVSMYPQQPSPFQTAMPHNELYSPVDSSIFSPASGVIPPTPQTTQAPAFYLPSQPQQQGYLDATPSHANSHSSLDSNTNSISSLSRSCSPAPMAGTVTAGVTNSTYSTHLVSPMHTIQPSNAIQSSPASHSPNSSSSSLYAYGIPVSNNSPSQPQTWRCAYPNCSSRALFTRGCDLRKHFNRHSKHLFCRIQGCPQSAPPGMDGSGSGAGIRFRGSSGAMPVGGFSSKKDRARHEAKHNPKIMCEWTGEDGERCSRKFSRVDNMKDHVRRIHRKGQSSDDLGKKGAATTVKQEGLGNLS